MTSAKRTGAAQGQSQTWRERLTVRLSNLPQQARQSPRLLAVSLLIDASPRLALAVSLWTLANALGPVLLLVSAGQLIDTVPDALRRGASAIEQHRLTVAVVVVGALYAITVVLGPIYDGLRTVSRTRLTFALQRRLISAVGGPIGISHLEDATTLNRIAGAQGALTNYFPADAPVVLAAVLSRRASGLIACVIVAWYWWWLGLLLAVLWVAIRRPLQRILLAYISAFGGEASVMRRADYLARIPTGAGAAKEVRIFGLAHWFIEQFRTNWHLGMQVSWHTLSRYRRTVSGLAAVTIVTYALGTWVVADGARVGVIDLAAFATLLPILVLAANVGMMTMDDVQLEWMLAALPNMGSLEKELAENQTRLTGTRPASRPKHEVRFDAVKFAYPKSERLVFSGLDLVLPAGRSTAIVGANGVGKTTLVKLLCRLYEPADGRIVVDGTPLTEFDAASWRRNISVVFQDFNRYPATLADNIAFGSPEHVGDLEVVYRVAERVGLAPLVDSLPHGWSTIVSSRYAGGVDLSRGQWQRVVLARALFAVEYGVRLLVLDEPTASLDVRGEAELYERFLDLSEGTTTLLISHRFASVRRADLIYVIEEGRVSEQGSHEQLIKRNGTYARLFFMQASRFDTATAPRGGTTSPGRTS